MIKQRGTFTIHDDGADVGELMGSVDSLPKGEYEYLLFDKLKNRSLPYLKYLFGVVLKTISDSLPNHPPVDALYRWFERAYAPHHSCIIDGQTFDYVDLKNEKSAVLDYVIERIIQHSRQEWGIIIPDRDILKTPEARELYTDAYAEVWNHVLKKPSTSQQ